MTTYLSRLSEFTGVDSMGTVEMSVMKAADKILPDPDVRKSKVLRAKSKKGPVWKKRKT